MILPPLVFPVGSNGFLYIPWQVKPLAYFILKSDFIKLKRDVG
jgi:hypothetical protein